ncbi:MAG: AAA family ATPase [Cyclobacteriaceae bacterium]|nr:AAA family ATPase [Cyclobacteriaceae bacterium]
MEIINSLKRLKEIAEFSKTIFEVHQNNDSLFNFLDALDVNTKKDLFEKYKESEGVVLSLRKKVGEQFISSPINRLEIENLFQKGKRENPTRFTVYKNLFSILYPFVTNKNNDEVYDFLYELASQLQVDLQLKESTEIKINGFDGSRNTGDTHAWFAIYNNSYPNQKTAMQLFFSIQNGKVSCALYDRRNNNFIERQEIELNESYYESILDFYKKHSDRILKDNYRAEILSKYSLEKLIKRLSDGEVHSWLMKPGEKGFLWKDALKEGNIRIGWRKVIDDIYASNNFSDEFILRILKEHYPKEKEDTKQTNNKISILSFLKEMKAGDIIFAVSGVSNIIGIGVITSEIVLDDDEEYNALREVDWLVDLVNKPYQPDNRLPIKTVTYLENSFAIDILKNVFKLTNMPSTSNAKKPTSLNIILYGPPGTGKTYNSIDRAVQIAKPDQYTGEHTTNKKLFDLLRKEGQIEFVTFHQNYTYEDFISGIKPDVTSTELRFKTQPGVFYKICQEARLNYEASKSEDSFRPIEEDIKEMLEKITEDHPLEFKTVTGKPFWLFDYSDNTIYLRKSNNSEKHTLSISTIIEISQFGREMISGLSAHYGPIIEYLKKNRRRTATKTDLKNYVIVIDEINRANISKVFGELITLIEEDKRIGSSNELRVRLPNGDSDFGVPPNLYIIGTMNTADKSIALIDIALRRRFEFEGMYPDAKAIKDDDKAELLIQINQAVYEQKKSADYLIGHAYFMNESSIPDILTKKVIPLLMEYFSGKINLVIDCFKSTAWELTYNTSTYTWEVKPSLK